MHPTRQTLDFGSPRLQTILNTKPYMHYTLHLSPALSGSHQSADDLRQRR